LQYPRLVKWGSIIAVAAGMSTLISLWDDMGLPGIVISWHMDKVHKRVDRLEVNQIKNDLIRAGNAATNLTILIKTEEKLELAKRNQEFLRIWKEQLARMKQEIKEKEARLTLLRKKNGWVSESLFL